MYLGPCDYSDDSVPQAYSCSICKAHGCKLWREYQTFADHIQLYCCDCAGKNQKKDVSQINPGGKIPSIGGWCDQIGWLVPAVPTTNGITFWGYTSVPKNGCKWWINIPNRV